MAKAKKDYKIKKKRSGRYAVVKQGQYVNGEEKAKILHAEGLIKLTPPSKKEEAPAEESSES